MGCCLCPSFSKSKLGSKSPLSDVYISPLPKSQVFETQPAAVQSQIQPVHQVANSISQTQQKIQIGDADEGIVKRVHFAPKVMIVLDEDDLKSFEADSKQSSGEGESYGSLFSLKLVDGWRTANEEEVMSKEISSSIVSRHLVEEELSEDANGGFTFPTVIQLKSQNGDLGKMKSMSGAVHDEYPKGETGEVSVDSSLSSWLVEPENNNTHMSSNAVQGSISQKQNGVLERRRVLGELSLVEVNQNLELSHLKGAAYPDCHSSGIFKENMKQKIRRERSSLPKQDQKVDLQRAIPLGLSLARAALSTGMV